MLETIAGLFAPVTKLIELFKLAPKDKSALQNELAKIQADVRVEMMQLEQQLIKSQGSVVLAEAQGASALQRLWRPILMMMIIIIVAFNYILVPISRIWTDVIPMLAAPVEAKLWILLQIGVGGYVSLRSVEKIVDKFVKAKGAGKNDDKD